jgi:hypothetical protein
MYGGIVAAIAIILTATAYAVRRATLGAIACVGWALLSFWAYQNSTSTWDIYYILFFCSMLICIACFIEVPQMKWGSDRVYPNEYQENGNKKESLNNNPKTMLEKQDERRARRGLPSIHDKASVEDRKWRGKF